MSNHSCLNCGEQLNGNFCRQCGQRSATHRITVKHFIMHDLLHGIWHLERGLLFTLKEALVRPGYIAVAYIQGRRIRYYNFFYLLLLVLGANVLTTIAFERLYDIPPAVYERNKDSKTLDLTEFLLHNFKLLLFLLIPVFSVNSMLVFRKLKLNIAEHSIIAGVVLLCGAAWYMIFNLYYYLTYHLTWKVIDIISGAFLLIVFLVPVIVYWQSTRKKYSFPGYIWRIITWYVILLIEAAFITWMVYLISGKESILIN